MKQNFLFLFYFILTSCHGYLNPISSSKSIYFFKNHYSGGNIPKIPSNSGVITIENINQFNNEVEKATKLKQFVVVDFSAKWCGPCRMIAPHYDEIATSKKYPEVVFLKVDVDEVRELAAQYHIRSMPTFLFLRNGEVGRFSGANIDLLHETIQKSLK